MNYVNREIMKSAKKSAAAPRKRAPKTGTPVLTRFQDELLSRIEEWRAEQRPIPSTPEAVRRLVEQALSKGGKK